MSKHKGGRHVHEIRGIHVAEKDRHQKGRYGFMFPDLEQRPDVKPSPSELGWSPGPMADIIPSFNDNIVAGLTYFGQFIAHDITYDPTPIAQAQSDPDALTNFRTPAFDLDSLYGGGPDTTPQLYDTSEWGRFWLDAGREHDLPRNAEGTAIIKDPRNDETLMISQLHLAFIKFHNKVLDAVRQKAPTCQDDATYFAKAQRLVRWHYQWIILHEFLPTIVDPMVMCAVKAQPGKYYCLKTGESPYIPLEFSAAAYRFGHSLVQASYWINAETERPIFDPVFSLIEGGDLSGGRPVPPEKAIHWKNFFNTGVAPDGPDEESRQASRINAKLALPLHKLPRKLWPNARQEMRSLAILDLTRGQELGLPSGQCVASRMGYVPLAEDVLWKEMPQHIGRPAPLLYYILKEAEVQQDGKRLGQVGGRIVAEVFLGLLRANPESYINKKPDWEPVLPRNQKNKFTMVELLNYAGVKTD